MASPFTQVYRYNSPGKMDASSVGEALVLKQQQYDANYAKMQQLVGQYAGMEFARDVDNRYLGARLNKLVDYVNSHEGMDYADVGLVSGINHHLSQALDSNVQAAIQSTKAIAQQNAEISEIRKKSPESYSQANEWYAKQGLEGYMNSDRLGEVYQPGQYIPYVDKDKLVFDNIEKIREMGHNIDVRYNEVGGMQIYDVTTSEVLTATQAAPYIEMLLGEKGKTQTAIDAMYKGRVYSDDQVRELWGVHTQTKVDQVNNEITSLNEAISSAPEGLRKIYIAQKEAASKKLEQLNKRKRTKLDRNSMLFSMEEEDSLARYSNIVGYTRQKERKFDSTFFDANIKLEDMAIKKEKLNIAKERLRIEKAKLKIEEDLANFNRERALKEGVSTTTPEEGLVKQDGYDPSETAANHLDLRKKLLIEIMRSRGISEREADFIVKAKLELMEQGASADALSKNAESDKEIELIEQMSNTYDSFKEIDKEGEKVEGFMKNMLVTYVQGDSYKPHALSYIPEGELAEFKAHVDRIKTEKGEKVTVEDLEHYNMDNLVLGAILSGTDTDNDFTSATNKQLRVGKYHMLNKMGYYEGNKSAVFEFPKIPVTEFGLGPTLMVEGAQSREGKKEKEDTNSLYYKDKFKSRHGYYAPFTYDAFLDDLDEGDLGGLNIEKSIQKDLAPSLMLERLTNSYINNSRQLNIALDSDNGKETLRLLRPYLPVTEGNNSSKIIDKDRDAKFILKGEKIIGYIPMIDRAKDADGGKFTEEVVTIDRSSDIRYLSKWMDMDERPTRYSASHPNPIKPSKKGLALIKTEAERAKQFSKLTSAYKNRKGIMVPSDWKKTVKDFELTEERQGSKEYREKYNKILGDTYSVGTEYNGGQAVIKYSRGDGEVKYLKLNTDNSYDFWSQTEDEILLQLIQQELLVLAHNTNSK